MINNKTPSRDIRWEIVRQVGNLIAILKDIEQRLNFINTHAIRANPLDVAVNLHRIHEEATGGTADSEKLRKHLFHFQDELLREIYNDLENRNDEEMPTNNTQNGERRGRVVSRKANRNPRRLRPKYRGGKRTKAQRQKD